MATHSSCSAKTVRKKSCAPVNFLEIQAEEVVDLLAGIMVEVAITASEDGEVEVEENIAVVGEDSWDIGLTCC